MTIRLHTTRTISAVIKLKILRKDNRTVLKLMLTNIRILRFRLRAVIIDINSNNRINVIAFTIRRSNAEFQWQKVIMIRSIRVINHTLKSEGVITVIPHNQCKYRRSACRSDIGITIFKKLNINRLTTGFKAPHKIRAVTRNLTGRIRSVIHRNTALNNCFWRQVSLINIRNGILNNRSIILCDTKLNNVKCAGTVISGIKLFATCILLKRDRFDSQIKVAENAVRNNNTKPDKIIRRQFPNIINRVINPGSKAGARRKTTDFDNLNNLRPVNIINRSRNLKRDRLPLFTRGIISTQIRLIRNRINDNLEVIRNSLSRRPRRGFKRTRRSLQTA